MKPLPPEGPRSFRLDPEGMVAEAKYIASPNWDDRPPGCEPSLIVIHSISLPPGTFGGEGIVELFTNRLEPSAHPYYQEIAGLRVSSHFLIRRDGMLLQFVSCARRAWHAGASEWRGQQRCNDFSIGIELEGTDVLPFEDAQYETLETLTLALRSAYPLRAAVGHSDIAPGRKTDPGSGFDWRRYRAARDLIPFPDRRS